MAVQIFSHSVAGAMRTVIKTGQITSGSENNTVDFVQIINNLFNTLNSRQRHSVKPFIVALSIPSPEMALIIYNVTK